MLGDLHDMFRPVREIRPSVITLGFNQHFDEEKLKNELLSQDIPATVVRIGKYSDDTYCSTSLIIRQILGRYQDEQ